ncbi:MAG: inositol monophosphatase [Verrucomicrobia bacterium]|nr:inositol monophosphatase [Verrucomicrobiota bacterium]
MFDPSLLTFVATQAALKAGELLSRGFGTNFTIASKPGAHNLVTEYDMQAERSIIASIQEHFPDHAILAEESGKNRSEHPVTWIIDPLDGTVNFAHGVPTFSVSIAAAIKQEIVSGVIYQPMTKELFVAQKGKGAYLNGSRLAVSEHKTLKEALLATGFPYNVEKNPYHCIEAFTEMQAKGVPIRRLGSAAIDLAYVAAGKYDAYWEVSLHPWDVAAGILLIQEAGGQVTHFDGKPHAIFQADTLVASNGHLHKELLTHLSQRTP